MTPITVLYDPSVRLIPAGRLWECGCGWGMTPSQDGRHSLVYRCDPVQCGLHTADVTTVEEGLALAYHRWVATHGGPADQRITPELIKAAYRHVDAVWVRNGHVEAATFIGRK